VHHLLAYFFVLSFSLNAFAQEKPEIFTVVEEMPNYYGGTPELMQWLAQKINYPSTLREKMIGGKSYIKFVVDSSGNITNVEVVRSSGFSEFDAEALRVVKSMPRWVPGKQNGKPVNVYFNLPVSFSLSGEPYIVYNIGNKDVDYVKSINQYQSGEKSAAIESLEKALEKSPLDADVLYNLGVIRLQKKDKKKGCQYLKKAVELNHKTAEKVINSFCN
jgi:TonB family protein